MIWRINILALLALISVDSHADIRVNSQASLESTYRWGKQFENNRVMISANAEHSIDNIDLDFRAWGWKSLTNNSLGVAQDEFSVRSAKASYWGDSVGFSAGVQELRFGETFGFQPNDLMMSRNYRDYSLLDSARNRIPVLAFTAFVAWERLRFEAFFNPNRELPILPATIGSIPLSNAARSRTWVVQPEIGAKVRLLAESANVDLLGYRHMSRTPVLVPRVNAVGSLTAYETYFEPVSSLAAAFSKSEGEWVFRADGYYTFAHPVYFGTQISYMDPYSVTLGADWHSVKWSWLTLGAQAHLDKFAFANQDLNWALSLMARTSFWNELLAIEAQAYSSLVYQANWISLGGIIRKENWEFSLTSEIVDVSAASVFALFSGLSRIWSRVSYHF